jgi:hypothetical protein
MLAYLYCSCEAFTQCFACALEAADVALLSNANISLMLNCLYVYLVGACKPAIDSTLLLPLWEFW